MVENLILVLAILALAAVLANQSMALVVALREARERTKTLQDQADRLLRTIETYRKECASIDKEIAAVGDGMVALRQVHDDVRRKLTEAAARTRRRLLILSDRRGLHDQEWVVVITNTRIGEVEPGNPLAEEWAKGRAYLVWAESDKDAAERSLRRFGARPGYAVKSVEAVKENLYPRPPLYAG